jgi:hypothetical protein
MKHRVFLIAALFAFVLGGVTASAEDARKIEQFIAKNIDGTISDFSLFYRNTTDSELRIDAFFTGRHYVSLGTEKGVSHSRELTNPRIFYTISSGSFFINYNPHHYILQDSKIKNELQNEKNSIVLSWHITHQEKDPVPIYLSGAINSNMDFLHKNQKDCVFAEIIKLMDGNNLSFALLVANHTSKKIVLTDLYGDGNQVKLKFPNGRVFSSPFKKKAKSIELKPGEIKTFKIELDQLLKESKDFSMKDFEFGLTELVWELKLDKEQAITRNFWLVKFNGELPKASEGSGYKLDGPLTLETFRDKKISALPAAKSSPRNIGKDNDESETKESSAQSTEK